MLMEISMGTKENYKSLQIKSQTELKERKNNSIYKREMKRQFWKIKEFFSFPVAFLLS